MKRMGHVNEYLTMHCFGNPRLTNSMTAYMILTEYSGNSRAKLHCWNVVNKPYLQDMRLYMQGGLRGLNSQVHSCFQYNFDDYFCTMSLDKAHTNSMH